MYDRYIELLRKAGFEGQLLLLRDNCIIAEQCLQGSPSFMVLDNCHKRQYLYVSVLFMSWPMRVNRPKQGFCNGHGNVGGYWDPIGWRLLTQTNTTHTHRNHKHTRSLTHTTHFSHPDRTQLPTTPPLLGLSARLTHTTQQIPSPTFLGEPPLCWFLNTPTRLQERTNITTHTFMLAPSHHTHHSVFTKYIDMIENGDSIGKTYIDTVTTKKIKNT